MVKPDRKTPNRIVGFRKQLRQFIKENKFTSEESIGALLQAVDEKALEYLETK